MFFSTKRCSCEVKQTHAHFLLYNPSMIYKGFLPFFDENSEILILGSFPSVISRETNFYYGNKQNRFWKILSESFGEPAPETIGEKQALLKNHKIALWDVVAECEITGSLDSTIKNYKVADLRQVLDNAKIKKIILNGGKAKEIFLKNFRSLSDFAVFLPSTSPLNTRFDKTIWLNALKTEKD